MRRTLAGLTFAALAVFAMTASVTARAAQTTRQVMYVGNNWAGTISVVDAHTFRVIKVFNAIPDKAQRMQQIESDPVRLAYFLAIRQQIGQGHDQFVDDMFSTHDGHLLAVSRPRGGRQRTRYAYFAPPVRSSCPYKSDESSI